MSDLRALIERVEKLDGPSREVDARLAVVGGYVVMKGTDERGYSFFQSPVKRGDWAFLSGCKDGIDDAYRALGKCLSTPSFTASLDAAIALCERVLPGWFWRVGRTSLFPNGWAYISRMHPDHCTEKDEASCSDGKAATPAIALVLATLRALEAQEGEG